MDISGLITGPYEAEVFVSAPDAINDCQKVSVSLTILSPFNRPTQTSVNLRSWELEGLSDIAKAFFEAKQAEVEDTTQQEWFSIAKALAETIQSVETVQRPLDDPLKDFALASNSLSALSGTLSSWGAGSRVPASIGESTIDFAQSISKALADETAWSNLGILRLQDKGDETLYIAYDRVAQRILIHFDIYDPVPAQIDGVIPVTIAIDEITGDQLLIPEGEGEVFPRRVGMIRAEIQSPGELRVYDEVGRVSGMVNGQALQNIPSSALDGETIRILLSSDSDAKKYQYEIVGTEEGLYGLQLSFLNASGRTINFPRSNIAIAPNEVHFWSVDWDEFSISGDTGWSWKIDIDGDGSFDSDLTPRIAEPSVVPGWFWPQAVLVGVFVLVVILVIVWMLLSWIESFERFGRMGGALERMSRLVNIRLPRPRLPRLPRIG